MEKDIVPTDEKVDLEELEGLDSGFEGVRAQSQLLPRLTILQKISPEVDETTTRFIPEAKPGMFCDVSLSEIWETLTVIPVYYSLRYIEWLPDRGGFVMDHGDNEAILRECTKDERFQYVRN